MFATVESKRRNNGTAVETNRNRRAVDQWWDRSSCE